MNERYIRALVKLTRVASAPTLDATIEHLSYDVTQKVAGENHGVTQGAVARLTTKIVQLDKQVTEITKIKNNS